MLIRDDREIIEPDRVESPPIASAPASAPGTPEPPKPQPLGEIRPDLKVFRGGRDEYGKRTWVIFDPVGDAYFRIGDDDYRIIRLWTGNPEAGEFVEKLRRAGINTTREHLVKLSAFLFHSHLQRAVYRATEAKAAKVRGYKRDMFWHMVLNYYLFFRIPLWTPDRFIVRTRAAVEAVFNRWTLAALRVLAAIGYLCLVVNFYKFTDAFAKSINFQGVVRYSIAVVLIKIVHEFCHAYTARHFGCRVRRMGVAFIFFFPRLYTDLTDSWRIHDRYRRFLIDGAGIFSELVIGGIAALVWANTGEGVTHTVAYYIFAVSIINTVMINGNPFIRYDGYYMLMDLVNIDNLQKRGVDVVRNFWRKHLFGLPVEAEPARGLKLAFLIFYGIGMFVYRIFLYFSIILLVYFNFAKALGIVLLMLEVYLMILKPIIGEGKYLVMNRAKLQFGRTAWTLTGAGVLLALLLLPLPWRIAAPCEVKSEGGAMIYAPVDGFVTVLPPVDGAEVKTGDLLLEQRNPMIDFKRRDAEIDIKIHEAELDRAERNTEILGQSQVIRRALESSRNTLEEMKRREANQKTFAPASGVFTRYDRQLIENKYLNRGDVIGSIHSPNSRRVTAFVPEDDVKHLKSGDGVTLELNNELETFPGKIIGVREMLKVSEPSPVLDVFGGPILTVAPDEHTFIPQTAHYLVEIELEKPVPTGRSGTARIRKFSSVAGNFFNKTLKVLRTELSF